MEIFPCLNAATSAEQFLNIVAERSPLTVDEWNNMPENDKKDFVADSFKELVDKIDFFVALKPSAGEMKKALEVPISYFQTRYLHNSDPAMSYALTWLKKLVEYSLDNYALRDVSILRETNSIPRMEYQNALAPLRTL